MTGILLAAIASTARAQQPDGITGASILQADTAVAVSLLASGIFIGAVWANISWGNYWSWDPKETWALITLMICAIPLHLPPPGSGSHHQGYHLFVLVAFLSVLMTYFGVNYYLAGLHSYA